MPEGFDFSTQGGAEDQKVNGYVVAAKGKTLCLFKAADDSEDGKEETAPVAFFQCSADIKTFDVADLERSNIAVVCADGQALQLWAAVLQIRG